VVQFNLFPGRAAQLALLGAFSLPIFGAILLSGAAHHGRGVALGGHDPAPLQAHVLGLFFTVIGLAGAGWAQGRGLDDPAMSFAAIAAGTRPWLHAAAAGEGLLAVALVLASTLSASSGPPSAFAPALRRVGGGCVMKNSPLFFLGVSPPSRCHGPAWRGHHRAARALTP